MRGGMRRTIDASAWDFPGLAGGVTTFLDPGADPRHAGSFLDQVPSLRAVPIISMWPEIEDTANGLLEEAYCGGDRALEVAVELATQTRDEFTRDET